MNSDVLRARQIMSLNAVTGVDRLRRIAQGEPVEDDPQQLADSIEQAIRILERLPDGAFN